MSRAFKLFAAVVLVQVILLVGPSHPAAAAGGAVAGAPWRRHALAPSPSAPGLNVVDNLRLDLVLSEPTVQKPLYLNFDERGRLWVVQYRQYPWPAGLKLRSHDDVWRNVYDPPFPPPPPFEGENSRFRGRDEIAIFESTRGDGVFDKKTVFLDGLNLATAALRGRGGVFVMNPPYLLFYPCDQEANRPSSTRPQVLLSGFGIEDTHSIANSLRWGPDGWIYGAQGSTVSSAVVRYGADGAPVRGEKPLRIMGQNIWRYHPQTRRFEIFAEGGGNTFGVVFDSKGRLFSGHNGGNTRGFHYSQGGYYQKTFDKHGALSNPYAFTYIGPMDSPKAERFTHTFAVYEADAFPSQYIGKVFAIAPHVHYVVCSEIDPLGSTFQTHDLQKVIVPGDEARDHWFTPVDIELGPDGALYIADWYAAQANHYLSSQGKTNPDLGRVYRLASPGAPTGYRFDMGRLPSEELTAKFLSSPNPWYRSQALRLLGDRKDRSQILLLKRMLKEDQGQTALEALWALNIVGGFDDEAARVAIGHSDPYVRRWAIRLIGDAGTTAPDIAAQLAVLAKSESDSEVRSQLASTAKRLGTKMALPIICGLLGHNEDAADQEIPKLIWWALEAHASDRDAVLALFEDHRLWSSKLQPDHCTMAQNLMRRWATIGSQDDLRACARLLNLSPGQQDTMHLVTGFERAFEGRPIPPLPDDLAAALGKVGGRFAVLLGIRQRNDAAITDAIEAVRDDHVPLADRLEFVAALGDVRARPSQTVPRFLNLVETERNESLRSAALAALQKFNDPSIAREVVKIYNALPASVQPAAQALLASRTESARQLVKAVDEGFIKARSIQADTIDKLRLEKDPEVARIVARQFPDNSATAAEMEAKIARYKAIILAGGGNPLEGRKLFYGKVGCARCHTVFDAGGHIGPDLTSYDRRNLDAMLLAVVNPSAEIREGYEDYIIGTTDGRILDGFKVDENDKVFVLRGTDGQNNVIPQEQIESRRVSLRSLMPEGLLDALNEQELRDLFAFLFSTTPPK